MDTLRDVVRLSRRSFKYADELSVLLGMTSVCSRFTGGERIEYVETVRIVAYPWNPTRLKRVLDKVEEVVERHPVELVEYATLEGPVYTVVDGMHRVIACEVRGLRHVKAKIVATVSIAEGLYRLFEAGELTRVAIIAPGGRLHTKDFTLPREHVEKVLRLRGMKPYSILPLPAG